jgi:CBS domain-containing protein
MTIGEACNREVVILQPEAPVAEAARLMREHHVGDVVVVEKRNGRNLPVGILTDRDIVVAAVAEGRSPEASAVADLMSVDLVCAGEEVDLWEAFRLMQGHGVRRLPVTDRHGALVGILAADDLLELVTEQLADLVRLVAVEQSQERKKRG